MYKYLPITDQLLHTTETDQDIKSQDQLIDNQLNFISSEK
jgi:hypothetical protein